MDSSAKDDADELNHVLENIDAGKKEECTMCKFVFIFSFVLLLLVIVFVFVMKVKPQPSSQPLPPEKAPKIDSEAWNNRILELGITVHPELASSTARRELPAPLPSNPNLPRESSTQIKPK